MDEFAFKDDHGQEYGDASCVDISSSVYHNALFEHQEILTRA